MSHRDLYATFTRVTLTPRRGGFSPAVDVFYDDDPPRAIVQAELAGIDVGELTLEVQGRTLVLAGRRPAAGTQGRVFQRLEIEPGPFRRAVELGADVDADAATASYVDGILRVELPLARGRSRAVPLAVEWPR